MAFLNVSSLPFQSRIVPMMYITQAGIPLYMIIVYRERLHGIGLCLKRTHRLALGECSLTNTIYALRYSGIGQGKQFIINSVIKEFEHLAQAFSTYLIGARTASQIEMHSRHL